MALTYGFYNSVEGDRKYDAIQMGQIFDGIITDGVYATFLKAMVVKASENASEVIVQPGRCWFNHTWTYIDADYPVETPAPEVILDRVDALVIDINTENAFRENSLVWVQGTPSSLNPERPSLIKSVTHNQYPLAYVYRKAGTTMIYAADITNAVGTSETPFVTGVLTGINIDDLFAQWDDEFHTWENNTKSEFINWEATNKAQFSAWQSGEMESFESWENARISAYNSWFSGVESQQIADKAAWDIWYANLVESLHNLPADSAEYLQTEINDIKENGLSGSYIKVSTINPSLEGKTVTISNADSSIIKTTEFDSNLTCEVSGYTGVGNITISSTDGEQTASSVVNIPYFGRYSYNIAFWAASVIIQGDEELAGYIVTVKDSDDVTVASITLNDSSIGYFTATKPDTYTFNVTYDGDIISDVLEVTEEVTYSISLSIWKAEVNLYTTDTGLYGATVTINGSGGQPMGYVTLSSSTGRAIWYAKEPDEYKFIYTYGGQTMEVSLAVTQETTYEVEIHGGFNYRAWLAAGRVSETFESLDDILEDEPTLRQLFLVHDSVDYICNMFSETVTSVLADITKIFNTDLAAKWINLSDYALDQFYAVDGIKSIMNTADKYGYGEWVITDSTTTPPTWGPKGNVPAMTSNTAPYGTASARRAASGNEAYRAFNRDNSTTYYTSGAARDKNDYIAYTFKNPVCPKRVYIEKESHRLSDAAHVILKGSNDGGTTWETLSEDIDVSSGYIYSVNVNVSGYYLMLALFNNDSGVSSYFALAELQFYGRELKVSVPTMTSNTAPYGEVFGDAVYSTNYLWKAFDGDESTQTEGASATATWNVGYKFGKPVCVKMFRIKHRDGGSPTYDTAYTLQASNNGTNWGDLGSYTNGSAANNQINSISNDDGYLYYRIHMTAQTGGGHGAKVIQFYGLDYSEKEFEVGTTKKWLYDHGVEVESYSTAKGSTTTSAIVANTENQLYFAPLSGTSGKSNYSIAYYPVDLTEYTLARAIIGNRAIAISNECGLLDIWNTIPTGTYTDSQYDARLFIGTPISNPNMILLNVASINQQRYVAVETLHDNGRSISFSELWLE